MLPRSRATCLVRAIGLGVALLTPSSSLAQGWGMLSGLGYAGLGFGLGGYLTAGAESDGFGPAGITVVSALVGGLAGGIAGVHVGHGAKEAVGRGEVVGGPRRAAFAVGSVAGGAALGALASIPLINPSGAGTPLGSDRRTFTLLTLVGAGLGGFSYWSRRDELSAGGVAVGPAVSRGGGAGIHIRLRF